MQKASPLLILLICMVPPCRAVNDSLYFLFQRSTYLENLTMPGAWWANPASIAEINKKTALTATVAPLGYTYTIASVMYASPVTARFGWGIGILGAGINPNPDGSLQADNSGAHYKSRVTFSNPSIQLGAAAKDARDVCIGLLGDFGLEQLPDGQGGQANFAAMGIGLGVMTPYLFNHLSLAVSLMSTGHFWVQSYWDHDGKAGVRFKLPDSSIIGSLEYTFSLASGAIKYIYNAPANYYQVVKGLASIKVLSIAGVLAGFSDDLGILSENGAMIHLGAELRKSTIYPFFGGYEIGVSTSKRTRDLIIHRFWLGYCFG